MRTGGDEEVRRAGSGGFGSTSGVFRSSRKSEERPPLLIYLSRNLD